MSYPTEPTSIEEIRRVLEEHHPLGVVLYGRYKDEIVDVVRVREHDVEVILGTSRHDGVPHDAIALVPDDFSPALETVTGAEPSLVVEAEFEQPEAAHGTDLVVGGTFQADAEKLRGLGDDPPSTLDDLEAAHDPELGHLGES